MKGVSAVIATILMLIITIALAGMAYMYIMGYFGGVTSGIELADSYCSAGVVNIKIKNIGTTDIGTGAIEIYRSSPAEEGPCSAETTEADCNAKVCCDWGAAGPCAPKAPLPDGCAIDGSTPTTCCDSTITPGTSLWYKDATCGSAKSCVYRITPPVGKTVTATQFCT